MQRLEHEAIATQCDNAIGFGKWRPFHAFTQDGGGRTRLLPSGTQAGHGVETVSGSSPRRAHVAARSRPGKIEFMTPRFEAQRQSQRVIEHTLIIRPHRSKQIDMILMAQTHIELARRRHTNAVATVTEIAGERRNQPKPRAKGRARPNSARGRRCGEDWG